MQCNQSLYVTKQISSMMGYITIFTPKFKLWLCITEFVLHDYTSLMSPLPRYSQIGIWPFLCDCTVGTVGILVCCDDYFYVQSIFVHNCQKCVTDAVGYFWTALSMVRVLRVCVLDNQACYALYTAS